MFFNILRQIHYLRLIFNSRSRNHVYFDEYPFITSTKMYMQLHVFSSQFITHFYSKFIDVRWMLFYYSYIT